MGIKHFWYWCKHQFADNIHKLTNGETLEDLKSDMMEESIEIDNLMIDMNGVFHNSAQKIYKYGNHKPKHSFLNKRQFVKPTLQRQTEFFQNVCEEINRLVNVVKPSKRVILCVDGPAPTSKQHQQRKRRFVSALTRDEFDKSFDSNAITPGTKLMDYLTKYIDWYIRKQISENPVWKDLEVVFSNEKASGEGEHKCICYIRKYYNNESYCIHGMDADLIMLSLGTHIPRFYILREEPLDPKIDFFLVNIDGLRHCLIEKMRWDDKSIDRDFISQSAINDFIFMCFTVGNDFLPHIPAIEIIEHSIETMLSTYRDVCEKTGHLTRVKDGVIRFCRGPLSEFLLAMSENESRVLANKMEHKGDLFPDPILESCSTLKEGKYTVDIVKYRKKYYNTHFDADIDLKTICHEYLKGMQWVITYYTQGVPDWKWYYPYHYAPFAHTLAQYVKSYSFTKYIETHPTLPFIQLLSVLPPKSGNLLPPPLNKILQSKRSPLAEFCPEEFDIDVSGKRQAWEGTALLPFVESSLAENVYNNYITQVDPKERKRNILGKSFIYRRCNRSYIFKSYYGDIICHVETSVIDL